ncbi:MAG: BTAD domain-containing putative transcriptional regulator [Anaerolineae bacterium]|jgi:DNA-binding SARP family transcriptional activator/predicted ATPase
MKLLGGLEITLGGSPVVDFTSKKSPALLIYVAMTGRPHSREALSGLLWGESADSRARASLRTVLWDLRQQVPSFVSTDRQTVSFNTEAPHWLDVAAFADAIENIPRPSAEDQERNGDRALLTQPQVKALDEAVSLYRGEFMAGFFISEAPAFEDWMLRERERGRHLAMHALHRLIVHYKAQGAYLRGIDAASQLLRIAPWQEEAHRQLMRLLVLGGQRTAALAQYETCRQMLAEELGLEPTMETRMLRNRIRAGKPLESKRATATSSLRAPPGLHGRADGEEMSSIVGRDREVVELRRLLSDPLARLSSVVGADGLGKTRLALHVGAQLVDEFEHGAWFVPLERECELGPPSDRKEGLGGLTAGVDSTDLILDIARVLGMAPAGRLPLATQLFDYLRHREVLLVLDDFRPSRGNLNLVQDLLRHTPHVRVMLTARQKLGLESEQAMCLNALSVPPPPIEEGGRLGLLQDLREHAGVELFVQRARVASSSFEPSAHEARHVAEICRLTGGSPLGLELAAAWAGRVPLSQIVRSLERHTDRGIARDRGVLDPERALQGVLAASWDLLGCGDRANLCRLALLQGEFNQDAASSVAGIRPAGLSKLVRMALLTRIGAARYSLHPSLRGFALDKLADSERSSRGWEEPIDPDALQADYRRHYLGLLARREAVLRGQQAEAASMEIKRDWGHVRRAWRLAVAHLDVELLASSLLGLSRYIQLQGWLWEGEELLTAAIERVSEPSSGSREAGTLLLLGRLRRERAALLNSQRRCDQAASAAQKVVEMARACQDCRADRDVWRSLEAGGHLEWGKAHQCGGELGRARKRLEEALLLAGDEEPTEMQADILKHLGIVEIELEDLITAQRHLAQALDMYEDLELCRGRSEVLNALALTATARSAYAKARTYAHEGLALAQTIGDRRAESVAQTNLGRVANAQGDYDAAARACEQALGIARDLGDPRTQAEALAELALVHLREGDREAAWRRSLLAVELARATGHQVNEARALLAAGHVFSELKLPDQAVRAYENARTLQDHLGQSGQALESVAGLARASLANGDLARAQAFAEEILTHLESGNLLGATEPLRVYLTCYQVLEANDDPRARDVLMTASGFYEEEEDWDVADAGE